MKGVNDMKRTIIMMLTALLAVSLAACGSNTGSGQPETTQSAAFQSAATATASPEATPENTDASTDSEEIVYEFEFADIDGNVHKLSDYRGKPVYLRVWASWCSVCVSSLEDFDKFVGETEDFVILSVVMPSQGGELSAEEFTEWYKGFGYDNLVVLFDHDAQIVRDFGINAFPSQIMFDAEGHIVYGVVGLMPSELITETMQKIADESA
jgi:thiol-disulfide isomerase/thioredoxin